MTRGHRTFFFDINKSKNGNLYLKISESKKTASGFEHHRLMIFEEDMGNFFKTLQKSLEDFQSLKSKNQADRKTSLTANTPKKAYERWSQQEGDKLEIENKRTFRNIREEHRRDQFTHQKTRASRKIRAMNRLALKFPVRTGSHIRYCHKRQTRAFPNRTSQARNRC